VRIEIEFKPKTLLGYQVFLTKKTWLALMMPSSHPIPKNHPTLLLHAAPSTDPNCASSHQQGAPPWATSGSFFVSVLFAFLHRTRLGIHVRFQIEFWASLENQFVGEESIELWIGLGTNLSETNSERLGSTF
jgi:hypothetical protein